MQGLANFGTMLVNVALYLGFLGGAGWVGIQSIKRGGWMSMLGCFSAMVAVYIAGTGQLTQVVKGAGDAVIQATHSGPSSPGSP